jgi:hypothetical protein
MGWDSSPVEWRCQFLVAWSEPAQGLRFRNTGIGDRGGYCELPSAGCMGQGLPVGG